MISEGPSTEEHKIRNSRGSRSGTGEIEQFLLGSVFFHVLKHSSIDYHDYSVTKTRGEIASTVRPGEPDNKKPTSQVSYCFRCLSKLGVTCRNLLRFKMMYSALIIPFDHTACLHVFTVCLNLNQNKEDIDVISELVKQTREISITPEQEAFHRHGHVCTSLFPMLHWCRS